MSKRNTDHTNKPAKRFVSATPRSGKVAAKKKVSTTAQVKSPAINEPEHPLTKDKMEVHHHPDLHHKHKPWKEYLLEGLMIFIAVMMGFIAENIREDITNQQHATQLTLRLVQDLRTDTSHLNTIINFETGIRKSNDTLITLLQQPLAKADLKQIQELIYKSHSLWLFYPSNGAINAIKNELHLKQFANTDIITYISDYEGSFNLLRTVQDVTLQYQRTYLDPFLFDHFTPANLNAVFSKLPPQNTQMRNLTQEDLTHLAACMVLVRINTAELVHDNKSLKDEAIALLNYVNKTYDLKGK
jgi:hypothetical protein